MQQYFVAQGLTMFNKNLEVVCMESFNIKIIICGMALLLFGIIIAIMSKDSVSYIAGGLGLFFVVVGCFTKDDFNDKTK